MKHTLKALLFAVAVTAALSATAQKTSFAVTGGWTLPIGNYAHSDIKNNLWGLVYKCPDGGAGQGAMLGVQWCKPIASMSCTSLLLSLDLIYSDHNSDIKTGMFEVRQVMETNFSEVNFTLPCYYNIPLMVGLRHEWPFAEGQAVFTEVQVGMDYCLVTDRGATLRGGTQPLPVGGQNLYDYVYTDHFGGSAAVAAHLGVGCLFAQRWQVDAGLWYLGSHQVYGYEEFGYNADQGSTTLWRGKQEFMLGEITPLMVTVRIGFRI